MRNLHLTFVLCSAIKSKVKILQNFAAFSEYMNFTRLASLTGHKPRSMYFSFHCTKVIFLKRFPLAFFQVRFALIWQICHQLAKYSAWPTIRIASLKMCIIIVDFFGTTGMPWYSSSILYLP